MSIAAWDRQLKALAADVDLLLDYESKVQPRGDRAFSLRSVQLLQVQARLDQHTEQVRQLASREIYLMPREKALLHGARTLLARLADYGALRADVLAHGLWFNLLKTRLSGPKRPTGGLGDDFGGEDLVALTVRRGGLAQTETYLKGRLQQLEEQRRQLTKRYAHLDIEEANQMASLSLATRLGATPSAVLCNPLMSGLKLLMKTATAAMIRPSEVHRAKQLQSRVVKGTDQLLAQARHAILEDAQKPNGPLSETAKVVASLALKLEELEALTSTAEGSFAAALNGPIAPWRPPIQVQKGKRRSKTETQGRDRLHSPS